MPIVRATRRVAPAALPGARISAPSRAGAGIVPAAIERTGRQIAQLGGQLEAVERQETAIEAQRAKNQAIFKDKSDKLWASQQIIKTQDYWRDKGPTYTTGQGSAAIGSTDAASQDLEKFKTSILDSAQNNEQRALYDASFAVKREVILNKQKAFEVDQFRKAEVATNDSKIANAMREAAANPNDELAIFDAGEDLREGIDFAIQGMAPEQRKNVTATYVSTFHEGILNSMVTGNANNAKIYYDKNKKNILPENRPAIEKTLETEDTLQFAQQKTDELMLTYPDDYEKQLEVAREIDDPNKRKATVDLTKTRKKERDQLEKEANHEVYLSAMDKVQNAPDLESAREIAMRHDNPEEVDKLLAVADNRFAKKTKATVTDRDVQATVYEKIKNGEITEVRDLIEFAPDLSDGDYNRAITRLDNQAKNDKGIKTVEMNYATAQRAYLVQKDLDKYSPKDNGVEFMQLYEVLNQASIEKGSTLTLSEANELTATTIAQGELSTGWIWSDKMTRIQAEQAGKMHIWLPLVNDETIDQGKEKRDLQGWTFINLGVSNPSDELMAMIKKEGVLKIELSGAQARRYNELISKEKDR